MLNAYFNTTTLKPHKLITSHHEFLDEQVGSEEGVSLSVLCPGEVDALVEVDESLTQIHQREVLTRSVVDVHLHQFGKTHLPP